MDSLQLAFLVHGYYWVGVTNFGNFITDLRKLPWCVSNSVGRDFDIELEGYNRSIHIQTIFGRMYTFQIKTRIGNDRYGTLPVVLGAAVQQWVPHSLVCDLIEFFCQVLCLLNL